MDWVIWAYYQLAKALVKLFERIYGNNLWHVQEFSTSTYQATWYQGVLKSFLLKIWLIQQINWLQGSGSSRSHVPATASQSNKQTIRYIQWLIGKGNKRLFFLTFYCLLLSTHWMYLMAYLLDWEAAIETWDWGDPLACE